MLLTWLIPLLCHGSGLSPQSLRLLVLKGDQYFANLDFERAENYYSNALVLLKNADSRDEEARVKNKLTTVLWKLDKLYDASSAGHESLQFCLDHFGWNHELTVDALINLGIISLLNQNTLSLIYLEKANLIANRLYGDKHPKVAVSLQWIGMTCDANADSINTRKNLFGSLRIWSQLYGSDDFRLAEIYRFIGLFYNRWEELDSSHIFLNKAIELNDKKYGVNNIISANCINNIANSYLNSGKYDTMFYLSNEALRRLNKTHVYQRKVRSMAYFNMADASEKSGNFQAALNYIVKAIALYYPDISGSGKLANPEVETIRNYPYSQLFFEFKRKILFKLLETKQHPFSESEIKLSINQVIAIETALQDQIRSQLLTLDDILGYEIIQSKKFWDMTINKLSCAQTPGDTSIYTDVINLFVGSQLSIGFGLHEYFSDNKEYLQGTAVSQRRVLSEKIVDLVKKLLAAQTESSRVIIKEELLENKILLNLLGYKAGMIQKKLISSYKKPEYHYSKIQKVLKPNQILFMFTQTAPTTKETECFYQIVITSEKLFDIKHFDNISVLNDITFFNHLLTGVKDKNLLDSVGYRIYQALFEPYQSYLKDKEVIILPAGKLAAIPVDILMTDQELHHRFFETNLVYNIMSLDVLMKKKSHSVFGDHEKILAIAPSFNKERTKEIARLTNRDDRLIELPFARKECTRISQIFNTLFVEGYAVVESQFKKLAGKFPILHISTHGISDNGVCPTKLAFSKKELNEDGFLDFYEILEMKLHNDITVLSSCKSGLTGKEVPVGGLSLGWAFTQAGSQSAVVSLWDANDYASSVIMPEFYQNLKTGMTRPEALRQAKIKFIRSADNFMRHPYYWAGFQYYGPNEPLTITEKEKLDWIKPLVTVFLILLVCTIVCSLMASKKLSIFKLNPGVK